MGSDRAFCARATFADRWRNAVSEVPDRPFLNWEDAEEHTRAWTYEEFDVLVREVATWLHHEGAGPGRSVHLALENSPAFVASWLAAVQLGAPVVPSDPSGSAREIADAIRRTRPAVGLCATTRAGTYREAAAGGPVVVELDERDTELTDIRARARVHESPRPDDAAAVMLTSGTTSSPKGVELTQANYAFAGDVMAAAAAADETTRFLVVLPLFHANAQYYCFAAAISAGASVALMSRFSASRFLEQAQRHRATHASLFAAPIRMILASEPTAPVGYGLRHAWFAQNISSDQYEQIASLLGCRPRQLYGLTETLPAVLTNPAVGNKPASLGVPTLGCSVDLWGPERGEPVPEGSDGEVVVRGVPGRTLFARYLDDPAATAASFTGDWFRTGDLARRDDQGRFYFVGRRGDVLKVAGENVSTVEVESVLAEHPSVLEAAVVGAPDQMRDEVPVAYVVAAPGTTIDLDVLRRHCAATLAPSKQPRAYYVVGELPRTSVGKIRKFQLREQATPHDGT